MTERMPNLQLIRRCMPAAVVGGFVAACGAAGLAIRLLDPGTPPNPSSDVDGLWKALTLVWSWAAVWPAAFVAILIYSCRRRGFNRPLILGSLHAVLSLPLLATTIALTHRAGKENDLLILSFPALVLAAASYLAWTWTLAIDEERTRAIGLTAATLAVLVALFVATS